MAQNNEEEPWRLKSRSIWLKVGYIITKYFHKQANVGKVTSHIQKLLLLDGSKENNFKEILEVVKAHFENLCLEYFEINSPGWED
jgi:hypothetical protein